MTDRVERLSAGDRAAIQGLLQQDRVINLFLLGFLKSHAVDRGWWYGSFEDGALTGVTLVIPGRLAVPYCPDLTDAEAIGDQLYHMHRLTLVVGPRGASDALWHRWARGVRASRSYDQRLYRLDDRPPGEDPPGFRRAEAAEWEPIAEYSAAMEIEDLGVDPRRDDPKLHHQVVQERIKSGRTWIIEEDGDIVFQVNVGTTHLDGVQIGGTYVPPPYRQQGHARRGIAALSRRLLARFPRVTLHVNEANTPAVRVYEGCGYQLDAPFRLITP